MKIIISDHALVRYIERILEVDVEQIRERLAKEIAQVASSGARTFSSGGATYVFERTPSGDLCVVTVITEKMRRNTHHRRAMAKAKAKAVARARKP